MKIEPSTDTQHNNTITHFYHRHNLCAHKQTKTHGLGSSGNYAVLKKRHFIAARSTNVHVCH
jgi:hypothetical protein